MVYRKTKEVLHELEKKRLSIIAAAIHCVRKDGWSGMTSAAVSERAEVSMGKVFYHFADMNELAAKVELAIRERDIKAINRAIEEQSDPVRILTAALNALFDRLSRRVSHEAFVHGKSYRIKIERELADLIAPCIIDKTIAKTLAPAVLAALAAVAWESGDPGKRLPTAVLFVLNGLGISEAMAQRAIEAVS